MGGDALQRRRVQQHAGQISAQGIGCTPLYIPSRSPPVAMSNFVVHMQLRPPPMCYRVSYLTTSSECVGRVRDTYSVGRINGCQTPLSPNGMGWGYHSMWFKLDGNQWEWYGYTDSQCLDWSGQSTSGTVGQC